jgi:PKD domain
MKSFITLAASTPLLLLAGVGHAGTFQYNDPNCSSFTIDSNGVISCASSGSGTPTAAPSCTVSAPSSAVTGSVVTISASCSPAPITAYNWTPSSGAPAVSGSSTQVNFSTEGTYTYKVNATNDAGTGADSATKTITVTAPVSGGGGGGGGTGDSCPSGYQAPAGTTIVDIGSKDYYAKKDFDSVFDSAGSTFDSAVSGSETKALKFTNANYLAGFVTGTAGNYGANYKDWSLSVCPGDFSSSLPSACVKTRKLTVNMYYSTDGSQGCTIPVNTPVYLNIRSNVSGTAAGFVLQDVVQTYLQ